MLTRKKIKSKKCQKNIILFCTLTFLYLLFYQSIAFNHHYIVIFDYEWIEFINKINHHFNEKKLKTYSDITNFFSNVHQLSLSNNFSIAQYENIFVNPMKWKIYPKMFYCRYVFLFPEKQRESKKQNHWSFIEFKIQF